MQWLIRGFHPWKKLYSPSIPGCWASCSDSWSRHKYIGCLASSRPHILAVSHHTDFVSHPCWLERLVGPSHLHPPLLARVATVPTLLMAPFDSEAGDLNRFHTDAPIESSYWKLARIKASIQWRLHLLYIHGTFGISDMQRCPATLGLLLSLAFLGSTVCYGL